MIEEIFLDLPQGKFAALPWGDAASRPVLAFHGWLDNAASFAGLAPLLPSCRIVSVDLAGHGNTAWRPPGLSYHIVDFVSDAVQIVKKLEWKRFTLLGHSLGGGVAAALAAVLPERVEKLVLLESLGALTSKAEDLGASLREHEEAREALLAKRVPVYKSLEEGARARALAAPISEAGALTLARRGLKPCDGGFTWKTDPRLRLPSQQRLTEPQLLSVLREIQCPTLLVRGSHGLPFLDEHINSRRASLRDLQIETVEGHHHVHLDHPERVAPSVRAFLG